MTIHDATTVGEIVAAMQGSARVLQRHGVDSCDWNREPLPALIDHIVGTCHESLRNELRRLQALAAAVDRAHGVHAPHLTRVKAIVNALSVDLRAHMQKEELALFPVIRAVERGALRQSLSAPIAMLEHEHDHAANLLKELRELTGNFTPPTWACDAVRALYEGLAKMEAAMRVHAHLENHVLFPRAQRTATGIDQRQS